jgi:hypothetical protein
MLLLCKAEEKIYHASQGYSKRMEHSLCGDEVILGKIRDEAVILEIRENKLFTGLPLQSGSITIASQPKSRTQSGYHDKFLVKAEKNHTDIVFAS